MGSAVAYYDFFLFGAAAPSSARETKNIPDRRAGLRPSEVARRSELISS